MDTPAVSRAYLSRKLTRPSRPRRGHVAHGPRCPRLHASAVEGLGAKRPVAKGGPITPCEGRCRRCQQATRTRVALTTASSTLGRWHENPNALHVPRRRSSFVASAPNTSGIIRFGRRTRHRRTGLPRLIAPDLGKPEIGSSNAPSDRSISGQCKHRELATERCIVPQRSIAANGAQAGGGIRQASGKTDTSPAADTG